MSILHLLDRPISFHRVLAKVAGSAAGGVFLSQAVYWSNRLDGDRDGWFWKTQAEWEEETTLTRVEQENIRKRLVNLGILSEQRKGVPAKLWFKINGEKLESLILQGSFQNAGNQQTGMRETSKLECGKPANWNAGNQQTGMRETSKLECGKPANYLYTENTFIDYSENTSSAREEEKTEILEAEILEEESSIVLASGIPESIKLSQKVKNGSGDKISAADLTRWQNCWNEFKPQAFAVMRTIGPKRAKTITTIVSEFGDFEMALRGLEAALTYARSDRFWQDKDLDFENAASNNKILGWAEKEANPLTPPERKQARQAYEAATNPAVDRVNQMFALQQEKQLAAEENRRHREASQIRFDIEEDLRMGRYVSPDRLALLGTT